MFNVLLAAAAVTAGVFFGWWLGTRISRGQQLSGDDAVRLKRVHDVELVVVGRTTRLNRASVHHQRRTI